MEYNGDRFAYNLALEKSGDYAPRQFSFPESNKRAISDALLNLQIAISESRKRRSKENPNEHFGRPNHDTDFHINDLWNQVEDSKDRCGMLIDGMHRIMPERPAGSVEEREEDFESEARKIEKWHLDGIKLALAKKLTEGFRDQQPAPNSPKKWKKMSGEKEKASPPKWSTPTTAPVEAELSQTSVLMRQLQLNLSEIPFISGKSTGQSHSLSANLQEVLSLVRTHNLKPCKATNRAPRGDCRRKKIKPFNSPSVNSDLAQRRCRDSEFVRDSIQELLARLHGEYRQTRTKFEAMEKTVGSDGKRRGSSEKLERLRREMELKKDQIDKISNYQGPSFTSSEIDVKTAHSFQLSNTAFKSPPNSSRTSFQHSNKQRCLELLRNLKEIQSALR